MPLIPLTLGTVATYRVYRAVFTLLDIAMLRLNALEYAIKMEVDGEKCYSEQAGLQ